MSNSETIDWLERKVNPQNYEKLPDISHLPWRQQKVEHYKRAGLHIISLPLFAEPGKSAKSLGQILLTGHTELTAYYVPPEGGPAVLFKPDLFDSDWGYGPWFHQTILERQGSWFKLPKNPFPEPVWLDISILTDKPVIEDVMVGSIYYFGDESFFILGYDDRGIAVRPEQEADMVICHEEGETEIQPYTPRHIPYEDLFDGDGHLMLDFKYKKGC